MTARPATFAAIADRYRLRIRWYACGDPIAPGKFGHLYEHDQEVFGLVLEDATTGPSWVRTLRSRRRRALAGGFHLHQEAEAESVLLFDASDAKQARLALRLVGAKRRRIPSAAQLEALKRARATHEVCPQACAGAVPEPRNDDSGLLTVEEKEVRAGRCR
jgi:hypothetical protein